MKKLVLILMAGAALLSMGCSKKATTEEQIFPAVCGGYSEYRTLEDADKALFDSVYRAEPALTPYGVATQVVCGTNYRFVCHDGEGLEYAVTIFAPLPCYADSQKTEVTSVEWPAPASLAGTWTVCQWEWDDEAPVDAETDYPTVTFGEDGTLTATAGCNGMGGTYTYEAGVLTVPEGMCQTEMWCENERMMLNERLLGETLADTLTVTTMPDGKVVLQGRHRMLLAHR